jgi:hypothetical protein
MAFLLFLASLLIMASIFSNYGYLGLLFFLLSYYRNNEYRIGEFKKLLDYSISDQSNNLSDYHTVCRTRIDIDWSKNHLLYSPFFNRPWFQVSTPPVGWWRVRTARCLVRYESLQGKIFKKTIKVQNKFLNFILLSRIKNLVIKSYHWFIFTYKKMFFFQRIHYVLYCVEERSKENHARVPFVGIGSSKPSRIST